MPTDVVADALDELPFILRVVAVLTRLDKLTLKEVALSLGRSVADVRALEEQAIRLLLSSSENPQTLQALREFIGRCQPSIKVSAVVRELNQLTPDLILHLKQHADDLQLLQARVFEHLIAECLAQRGFDEVTLVGRDPSTSADIYALYHIGAVDDRVPYFVEVKRWRDRVGITVVNQVLGAMVAEEPRWGWRAGLIVSLAGFSEFRKTTVLDLAKRSILLRDKTDLLKWLGDYRPRKDGLWLPPH